ncbi:hypothetical protein HMPREF9554_00520 [Treponema phagedenis F0421]|nr:hypothetical protein HMPREF9554_00520 [Treponema phagedenis F0421]
MYCIDEYRFFINYQKRLRPLRPVEKTNPVPALRIALRKAFVFALPAEPMPMPPELSKHLKDLPKKSMYKHLLLIL